MRTKEEEEALKSVFLAALQEKLYENMIQRDYPPIYVKSPCSEDERREALRQND
jgi:hypothetical protein